MCRYTFVMSDKVGQAAGVYKMASSLGGAFGVAISAAVYGSAAASGNLEFAATLGILVNVAFGILSIISIITLVPDSAGKARISEKAGVAQSLLRL